MFSFPRKERSLAWIGRAITNYWPGNVNTEQELQIRGSNRASVSTIEGEYQEPEGTVHHSSAHGANPDSSSLASLHGGYVGGSNRQHQQSGSNVLPNGILDGSRDHVIVDMGDNIGEADGGEQIGFKEGGGISHGVLLGGVILGGLVLSRDEEGGEGSELSDGMGGGASGGEDGSLDEYSVGENSGVGARPLVVAGGGQDNVDRREDQVVVNMEDNEQAATTEQDEPVLTGPSRYLKRCQDMSYYFCVSGFRPFQKKSAATWYYLAGRILQKAVNCPSIWASLIQSICLIKRNYLQILSNQSYSIYVAFAFAFACLLVKIYSSCMLSFKEKKTERMLLAMHDYEKAYHSNNTPKKNGSWKLKLVTLLAISTFVCAGAWAVVGNGVKDTEDVILDASYELSQDIFIWNSNVTKNDTQKLINTYATEMRGGTVTMGLFVIFRDGANYLQVGMVFDLAVTVTCVMFAYVAPLIKEIKAVTPNVSFANIAEWRKLQARRENVWRKYVKLRSVKDEVNDIFDPLFKLLHMRNLTAYAFFMSLLIFRDYPWIFIVICGINLIKAEIAYFFAGKIAEVNDALRALIHNWAKNTGKITVDDEELDAGIILDQLEKDPIGLGKGKFLISHAFHFKFAGLVWSVFFGMSDEEANQ